MDHGRGPGRGARQRRLVQGARGQPENTVRDSLRSCDQGGLGRALAAPGGPARALARHRVSDARRGLARGGANERIHGLVLLDSLYAGTDQFADWIANNRSGFFISSYTPYTAGHNADLKHLLAERSVPYGSTLPADHLEGTVAFLPADLPHRDFVTNAWTDNPVADILDRIDDLCPKIETATVSAHN